MKKFKTLTQETYDKIINDEDMTQDLKEILGIPKEKNISIGDTTVKIGEKTNVGDVFLCEHNGNNIFYIVSEPIDEEIAYCYSVY